MRWPTRHRTAWLVWGAAFVAIEAHAVLTDTPNATLSQNIWEVCGVVPTGNQPRYRLVRRIGLLVFMAWLTAHLGTGRYSLNPRRKTH